MAKIRNLQVAGYGNFQGPGWYDVKKFGAKGDGITDDTASFNSALSFVQGRSGGTLYVPPGNYRVGTSSSIACPPGVSIVGHPYGSFIYNNSTTQTTFNYGNGPMDWALQYIKNLNFLAQQNHVGVCIYNNSGTNKLCIENCSFNGGQSPWLLNSNLIYIAGSSRVYIKDCYIRANNTFPAITSINDLAEVHVLNNTFVMPSAYDSHLVYVQRGTAMVQGNYFDLTEHQTLSNASCVYVDASANNRPTTITGNNFYTTGGPLTYAVSTEPNAWVVAQGNTYTGSLQRITGNMLAMGSTMDMVNISYGSSGGTSMILPNCVEYFSAQFTSTAPTITMPAMLFPGQEMTVSVRNGSSAFWSGIGVSNLNGPLITNVSQGQAVTFKAKVMTTRANGSQFNWTMVGQYTTAFTTS